VSKVKRFIVGGLAGALLSLSVASSALSPTEPQQTAQEPPPTQGVQKPNYDYMSGILSRSTKPLGLKEDPAVRRMLGQGSVPWAIRAGTRHILD
jgi:hypothetical protein